MIECIRLRVQELDFERALLYVRSAKGGKGRTTLFPKAIHEDMRNPLIKVKRLHEEDLSHGVMVQGSKVQGSEVKERAGSQVWVPIVGLH